MEQSSNPNKPVIPLVSEPDTVPSTQPLDSVLQQPIKPQCPYKSLEIFVLIVLLCLCSFVASVYFGFISIPISGEKQLEEGTTPMLTNTPKPSPTPIVLAPGKGEYTISHPKSLGPRIEKVIFDPLDVKKGDKIHISTALYSDTSISTVVGTLQSDTTKTELIFTKTGTDKTAQIWSTEFTLTDTLWYSYIATIEATNSTGSTTVTVAPRS